jgi:hypothetical protein
MSELSLDDLFDVPFTLRQRPLAVAADLRIARRLALLVMILEHCRGGRANLEQLHVLNWAIRNEQTRTDFLDFLDGRRSPDRAIVSYDPSLSRLIAFALAEKFVERNERAQQQQLPGLTPSKLPTDSTAGVDYRVKLSERGKAFSAELAKEKETLVAEREFLKRIGKKVTQQQIHDLLFWGLR